MKTILMNLLVLCFIFFLTGSRKNSTKILSDLHLSENEKSDCAKNNWNLIYSDDFKQNDLKKNWSFTGGEWKIKNDFLVCSKGGVLVFNRKLSGCQRIEFEALSEVPGDLSPIIHSNGKISTSGYLLQFGGLKNKISRGRRLNEFTAFNRDCLIKKGKLHHIIAEFDGTYVRLIIDGSLVYEYLEKLKPLLGKEHSKAGIYIHIQGKIKSAKIYTKQYIHKSEFKSLKGKKSIVANAENYDDFAKWGGQVFRNVKESHSGSASLEMPFTDMVYVPGMVEIKRAKTYELSGYFKSKNSRQLSRVLFDIRFFNADKKPINAWAVRPFSTVSRLVSNASKGNKTLRIAKKGWPSLKPLVALAFNAKDDFSDLPNLDTNSVIKIKEKSSEYLITLRKTLKKDYPIGTKVRLHKYLNYPRVYNDHVPGKWTKFAMTISAKPASGARPQDKIWEGAKYVRIAISHQYSGYPKKLPKGAESPILLFDDITFKEVILK